MTWWLDRHRVVCSTWYFFSILAYLVCVWMVRDVVTIIFHLVLVNCVKHQIVVSAINCNYCIYQPLIFNKLAEKKIQLHTSVAYHTVRHKYIISGIPTWYATNIYAASRIYQWRIRLYATNNISLAYKCGTPLISAKYRWRTGWCATNMPLSVACYWCRTVVRHW